VISDFLYDKGFDLLVVVIAFMVLTPLTPWLPNWPQATSDWWAQRSRRTAEQKLEKL
jgi:hypothetical protein